MFPEFSAVLCFLVNHNFWGYIVLSEVNWGEVMSSLSSLLFQLGCVNKTGLDMTHLDSTFSSNIKKKCWKVESDFNFLTFVPFALSSVK